MKLSIKLIFTFLVCLYSAHSSAQQQLTAQEFNSHLQKDSLIQLIDVRTPKEVQGGYIAQAQNLDWTQKASFEENIQGLSKDQPVYVYCLSGGRSSQAAKKLHNLGFEVYELQGGIVNWRKENLPEAESATTTNSLTVNDFTNLINSQDVVLINFSAAWCIPCQQMKPFIQRIQAERTAEVKLITLDADAQKALLKALNIQAIPTFKLYKTGSLVWEHAGLLREELLLEQITQANL